MIDEVEIPREAEAPDSDRPQLLGVQFSFDGEPREERDPEAAFDGILDGRVAAEFEGDIQMGERGAGSLKTLFQGTARARTRLADDERFADQGVEREGSTSRPGMPRGDDEHEGI